MSMTPVKVRGGGYGLDAELARKAAEKYDYEMEDEARAWIETITGLELGDDFGEGLRNGVILCELVNKIHPGVVKRIESKSKLAFKLMENVSAFLKACRVIGVNEFDLFETVDLFELKDLGLVVRCLYSLGRAVQKNYPNFDGPTLGVKESVKNERQFTEEQLTEARNTPGLLSYGSMRTMERMDMSRSNDVTFGADASRVLHRAPPPPPPPSAEKVEMISRARAAPPSPPHGSSPEPSSPVPPVAPSTSWKAQAGSGSANGGWSNQNTGTWSSSTTSQQQQTQSTPSPAKPVKSDSVAQLSKAIEKSSFKETSSTTTSPAPTPTPPKGSVSPKKSWPPTASTSATASPQKPVSPQKPSPERRSSGLAGLNSSKSSVDDGSAQEEAQQWIEEVLNEKFLASFGDSLKDGVILCQLMNAIKPGSVTRIQTSHMPFKQMENITAFLKACRAIGVQEFDLFETVDLFELKNVDLVVKCLHALGRTVQKNMPEFQGPSLGVKESTANKRRFSPAQLQEASGAVPLMGQHGMGAERPHDFDRSASVTFGRDAAVSGLEKKPSASDVTAATTTASGSTSPDARKPSGIAPRKTSGASDSGSAGYSTAPNSSNSTTSEPSPLQKSASKTSQLPSRTIWS